MYFDSVSPSSQGPACYEKQKGQWRREWHVQRVPVLDSRTSGLHVCSSRDVCIYCNKNWERHGVFYFRSIFLCFKRPIKKIRMNSKIPCPQSPSSFLVPRLCRRREAKRAMGTRMIRVKLIVTRMETPKSEIHGETENQALRCACVKYHSGLLAVSFTLVCLQLVPFRFTCVSSTLVLFPCG